MAEEKIQATSVDSCLYIHPSENPATCLVSPVLDGNNYHSWSRAMETALSAKNKLEFVDGTLSEPKREDKDYASWRRCNKMVVSWIIHSVSEQIRQSVLWMENAEDIWNDLRSRYFQGNLFRISELKANAAALKQGDLTITEYFTKLRIMWDELDNFRPDPVCSCKEKCPCGVLSLICQRKREDQAMQFLNGLNDQYSNVKSHVLLMEPIPTIAKIFSYVLQQERQLNGDAVQNESKVNNVSSINSVNSNACHFCGRPGHAEAVCYRKHGFPGQENKNKGKKMCVHCGRTGHTVDNCYRKHGFPPGFKSNNSRVAVGNSANSIEAVRENANENAGNGFGVPHNSDSTGDLKLSQQQYRTLLKMIQKSETDGNIEPTNNQVSSINTCVNGKLGGKVFTVNSFNRDKSCWILDSGATDHVSCCIDNFLSYYPVIPVMVKLPNGRNVRATHKGVVKISEKLFLQDVLYIPDFNYNLISVSRLVSNHNFELIFFSKYCIIQDIKTKERIGIVDVDAGLYVVSLENTDSCCLNVTSLHDDADIWHLRMGHLSAGRLEIMKRQYRFISSRNDFVCNTCHLAKQRKLPFVNSKSRAECQFDLIHVDIWGPCPSASMNGNRYFLTIVDDYTRYTWVILLKNKSEARNCLINFIELVMTQFEKVVKCIRSDNGMEFKMDSFYASRGIIHQTTCVETPEQNAIAERKHQHILNVARALLFQGNLCEQFWCFAVKHAVYLINRIPTPYLNNVSPYEKLYDKLSDISDIKVFGCLCYTGTLTAQRKKLDPRASPGLFLGYKPNTKGYLVFNLKNHSVTISRNVLFYETVFPYRKRDDDNEDRQQLPLPMYNSFDYCGDSEAPLSDGDQSAADKDPSTSSDFIQEDTHTTRVRNLPSYLKDYEVTINSASNKNVLSSKYPISSFMRYDKLSLSFKNVVNSIDADREPGSYNEACKHSYWIEAMHNEISALESNNTWTVTTLPQSKIAIGCRWVYKIKRKADGSIDRYKARLVAKGYTQLEGLDFLDTFSPVAKLTTIRLLLSIAAVNDWHLKQLDVNNAFLHGELHEEIYMQVPPGMDSSAGQVCKLNKSLYGLRQASRQWYEKLSSFLILQGYARSNADHSLFLRRTDNSITIALVYVDDIILAGNDAVEIEKLTHLLNETFKIKNLGDLTYFLGLEVARNKTGIHLCQRKYVLDLLEDAGMMNCAPAITPMNHKLAADMGDILPDPSSYRRLIGKLIYLTNTRPDITHAVQHLSQFVSAPTSIHQQAAMRILRYLKKTPGNGIFLAANSEAQLKGYSDSDWAGCVETRKSVTGYIIYFGNSPVSWRSKKQPTVSRSSTEAEYRALAATTCEIQWLKYLLDDIGINHRSPAVLYCDNQSAIQIASNQVMHERTKHIEIDCHIVREKINNGLLKLLPVSSKSQLADILTKPLPPVDFNSICFKLGMLNLYSQLEGGS